MMARFRNVKHHCLYADLQDYQLFSVGPGTQILQMLHRDILLEQDLVWSAMKGLSLGLREAPIHS